MEKKNYNIVKSAEGSTTTYRVEGIETANNAAICQALTEAAKDAWMYLTTTPGTYTAGQLVTGKLVVDLREDTELPKEMTNVQAECGTFRCCVGLKDWWNGQRNYITLFRVLWDFEKLANMQIKDRAMFTARMELGKLLCEARVVLPDDMKAICACCGNDPLRPSLNYPAIDLDRRCIVASDLALLVAKKITLVSIHYEDKVPETFYLPKEVAKMKGEVTVQLYERGCTVIDQNGTEFSVEHEAPYPRWEKVWAKYRGGMTIVDAKAMEKVVKGAVATLPEKGKGSWETVLLTHETQSGAICFSGCDGAKIVNTQNMPDIVATDEVAWRLPVNAGRMLKALALKPKTMWAGYQEYSTLPDRVVLEDSTAEMAVMVHQYMVKVLEDALRETEADYAVCGSHGLHRCYDKDGWLLEQMETKYPTHAAVIKPTFAEMLRKVLLAA